MKTWIVLPALVLGLTAAATSGLAQVRDQPAKPDAETTRPATEATSADPSASPTTGGDTTPSAVDPAESTKTGANAGEGASYNRSSEKGDSALPKEGSEERK